MKAAAIILTGLILFGRITARGETSRDTVPVRIVFTIGYQQHLFPRDPLTDRWMRGSLPYAASYIRAHRAHAPAGKFALINCGESLALPCRLYPENLTGQIRDFLKYNTAAVLRFGPLSIGFVELGNDPAINRATVAAFRKKHPSDILTGLFPDPRTTLDAVLHTPGIRLAVTAFPPGPEGDAFRILNFRGDTLTVLNPGAGGDRIGVADFSLSGPFTVKTVDITRFSPDTACMNRFAEAEKAVRGWCHRPLTRFTASLSAAESRFGPSAYASLFHRFQREVTGTDLSFFAPPRYDDSIPAGPFTFADLLRRFRYDERLAIVELTGAEIRNYLEYTSGQLYHRMLHTESDLLRLTYLPDGTVRFPSGHYLLDSADGLYYTVNLNRPYGHRVRIGSLKGGREFDPKSRYRVAVPESRLRTGALARGGKIPPEILSERIERVFVTDYRLLLREWLERRDSMVPETDTTWRLLPAEWAEAARKRELPRIVGR